MTQTKQPFASTPHLGETKAPADRSWWLNTPRDQFTRVAYQELPRMARGRGAVLADQQRWWVAQVWGGE